MIRFELTRAAAPGAEVSVAGDAVTINGATFDFTNLPEGAELPLGAVACALVNGPVRREGGVLIVPLIAPSAGGDLPPALWTPAPVEVASDGPVALPAHDIGQEDMA